MNIDAVDLFDEREINAWVLETRWERNDYSRVL